MTDAKEERSDIFGRTPAGSGLWTTSGTLPPSLVGGGNSTPPAHATRLIEPWAAETFFSEPASEPPLAPTLSNVLSLVDMVDSSNASVSDVSASDSILVRRSFGLLSFVCAVWKVPFVWKVSFVRFVYLLLMLSWGCCYYHYPPSFDFWNIHYHPIVY